MKLVPIAVVVCAVAAGVALVPSAEALGSRAFGAVVLTPPPSHGRTVLIGGRAYRVHCSLRVFIGGAPLDPEVGEQEFPMECVVSLTTANGGPVGNLPGRLVLTLAEGGERRIVVLNLIPSDVQQPIETAAYAGSTRPFDQTDGAVRAAASVRNGRRTQTIPIGNVPVEVIPLP